jgi:hypothetical protein
MTGAVAIALAGVVLGACGSTAETGTPASVATTIVAIETSTTTPTTAPTTAPTTVLSTVDPATSETSTLPVTTIAPTIAPTTTAAGPAVTEAEVAEFERTLDEIDGILADLEADLAADA